MCTFAQFNAMRSQHPDATVFAPRAKWAPSAASVRSLGHNKVAAAAAAAVAHIMHEHYANYACAFGISSAS